MEELDARGLLGLRGTCPRFGGGLRGGVIELVGLCAAPRGCEGVERQARGPSVRQEHVSTVDATDKRGLRRCTHAVGSRVLRLQVHEHLARKERACFLTRKGNGVLSLRHAGNGHGTEALAF